MAEQADFESRFVGNPEDRFSRGEAQMVRHKMSIPTQKIVLLQNVICLLLMSTYLSKCIICIHFAQ